MNTQVTLDFCKMVIEYMKLGSDINPLEGFAINYGEIDSWTEKYPSLAREFMQGESYFSHIADELVYCMYKFASTVKE